MRVSSLGGKTFPILKCDSATALPVKVPPDAGSGAGSLSLNPALYF